MLKRQLEREVPSPSELDGSSFRELFRLGHQRGLITAVVGMILLNGFPTPYHPVFNVPRFVEAAQKDGFFLVIESEDPKFKADECKKFLNGLNASGVWEVEN